LTEITQELIENNTIPSHANKFKFILTSQFTGRARNFLKCQKTGFGIIHAGSATHRIRNSVSISGFDPVSIVLKDPDPAGNLDPDQGRPNWSQKKGKKKKFHV
jgi:hypothetical protein